MSAFNCCHVFVCIYLFLLQVSFCYTVLNNAETVLIVDNYCRSYGIGKNKYIQKRDNNQKLTQLIESNSTADSGSVLFNLAQTVINKFSQIFFKTILMLWL